MAERLAVKPFTVYKLCEAGKLMHVRVSNALRVLPADLERFVKAGRK